MVDNRLLQETRTVRQRTDAEIGGDRLAQIGERGSRAEV
jgi:hypothetical protein